MDKLFAIVFLISFNTPSGSEEGIVQLATQPQYYNSKSSCEYMIEFWGPDKIVEDFMRTTNEDSEYYIEVVGKPFCTPYNTQTQKYEDYPQFDAPPADLPPSQNI